MTTRAQWMAEIDKYEARLASWMKEETLWVERETALVAEVAELKAGIERLKECAQEQGKGIGAKTMRVEIIPKPENRFAVLVTFPSGMEDGERRAAETAIHTINLVYETGKALAKAVIK